MANLSSSSASIPSLSVRPAFQCNFPVRYVILCLVLLATSIEYVCRYNINVSMVAMVRPANTSSEAHIESGCPYPGDDVVNGTTARVNGTYDWDASTQGVILGAFFYSYTLMQIPAGRISEEFGGRWVVFVSLLGSGVLNLLTPVFTYSVALLTTSRVALGILQGGLFPACFSIIYNWFPVKERALGYAFMEIGTMVGSIWASAMAGFLAEHGFAGGWPSTFYVSGAIAVASSMLWAPCVTSTPEEHWNISVTEMKHIRKQSTVSRDVQGDMEEQRGRKKIRRKGRKVPWIAILTNKAVLANVFSKFFLRWTFYTLIMKLPTYLNDVLHMSPTKNGLVNAAMYLASMFPMLCVGHISEYMIEKEYLTRTNTRKVFASIACFGSAICVSLIPSAQCNQTMAIGLLILAGILQAFDAAGNIPNPSDLSKNFPTTVFAIVNMVNTTPGFIVPFLAGRILMWQADSPPIQTWSIVFYLAAVISICGGTIYVLFGSAERQAFDFDTSHEEDEEETADLLSEEDDVTNRLLNNSPVRRLNAS